MSDKKHDRTSATNVTSHAPMRKQLSRRKKLVFALIAVSLAPISLAGLEGILRLFGLGGNSAVIREVGRSDRGAVVVSDAMGSASYFYANRSKPGSIFETTFDKPKPAGMTRIMLLGESAAKGFPEPPALAATAFLQAMLNDVWPNKRVELLNFSCTAIASFPVRGILTEAIEYEPDLVIVYCGNNEFFGAYGVASLHSAGDSVAAMHIQRWYRGLALTQFIDRFVASPDSGQDKALMERMIGQSYIAPDDPKRDSSARNVYDNVAAMIELCKARGVPIIVCNSPVNERDLAPLGEDDISGLPESTRRELSDAIKSAASATDNDASASLAALARFEQLPVRPSRLRFAIGKALYSAKRFPEAAAAFREAIELDPMPWRATQKINGSIERAAREHGAVFCDLVNAFRKASPGGCVGWELMDDHVHPSLQGQDLIARTLVQTLTGTSGPLHVEAARANALPNWETYARRLGDNDYERYGVAHTVRVLADIAFIRRTNPEMFDRFNGMIQRYEKTMDADVLRAVHDWQKPETHRGGTQRPISGMVARVRIKQGRFEEAEKLNDFAERCVPPFCSWNLEFSYFRLVSRQRVRGTLDDADRKSAYDAIERGRFLLSHGFVGTGLTERHIGRLHQLRNEWAEAIPYLVHAKKKLAGSDLVAADQALVESYARTGDIDAANQIIRDGEVNPEFGGLYAQMRQAYLTKPK